MKTLLLERFVVSELNTEAQQIQLELIGYHINGCIHACERMNFVAEEFVMTAAVSSLKSCGILVA